MLASMRPGVTWSTYGAMPGQLGYGWVALDSVKRVRESATWDEHYAPWQWFTSDVKQGHLASISWITPPFNESDHPGGPSLCAGENWTARQVNAIESSPLWKSTAIVIVWDDFGGFYDQAPPPLNPDGTQEGPRLPLIIVSPYAQPSHTDIHSTTFAGILAYVEHNFGLPPLDANDASAYDFHKAFNYSQTPLRPVPLGRRRLPASARHIRASAVGKDPS